MAELQKQLTAVSDDSKLLDTIFQNAHSPDKLSFTIGSKVIIKQNARIQYCIIKDVLLTRHHPTFDDIIKVQYVDSEFMKTFYRYELHSDPIYLNNLHKLCPGCTIDIQYKPNHWSSCYINNWGLLLNNKICTNKQLFSINGNNYSRYSYKIRCCPELLKLQIGSNIFVFDVAVSMWCYGTISNIIRPITAHKNSKCLPLNVFQISYSKNGIMYLKYANQFSSCIALMDNSFHGQRISDQCSKTTENVLNSTDLMYYKQLLQILTEHTVSDDILSILIQYIGCWYGLIMYIESKIYPLAIKKRNINLTPKPSTVYNEYRNKNNEFIIVNKTCSGAVQRRTKLCTIYETEGINITLHEIKTSALNPNALPFVCKKQNDKTYNNQIYKPRKKINNPYLSNIVKDIQKLVKIPFKLTDYVSKYVSENIWDIFHYMLTITALQFTEDKNKQHQIKIFNLNFHHKYTNKILYAIAIRCNSRGFEWCMMNKLFTTDDILDNNEWNITKSSLPTFKNFLCNDREKCIIQCIQTEKLFKQIINKTKWCKIKIYHGTMSKNNRVIWQLTQEQFKKNVIEFYSDNVFKNNINLIPILIMHNKPHIEYLYIIQIPKNDMLVDIGISFDCDKNNKVIIGGIHLNKKYIMNQYQLVNTYSDCKYLNTFKSIMDHMHIGNPDDWQNKLNAKDKLLKDKNKIIIDKDNIIKQLKEKLGIFT